MKIFEPIKSKIVHILLILMQKRAAAMNRFLMPSPSQKSIWPSRARMSSLAALDRSDATAVVSPLRWTPSGPRKIHGAGDLARKIPIRTNMAPRILQGRRHSRNDVSRDLSVSLDLPIELIYVGNHGLSPSKNTMGTVLASIWAKKRMCWPQLS